MMEKALFHSLFCGRRKVLRPIAFFTIPYNVRVEGGFLTIAFGEVASSFPF